MKYLTIAPDYTGFCIKDDFSISFDLKELCLPSDYINELSRWHEKYKRIIHLDDEERDLRKDEINNLDQEGLLFAKKLQHLVSGGAKVKYFSEGKMQYLPVQ